MHKAETFARVTPARPCPVCGKGDWCQVGERFCLCARIEAGAVRKCGEAGWLHKTEEKPVPKPKPKLKDATDWRAEAERYAKGVTPANRASLERHLGLPDGTLACFPLLGKGEDGRGKFWTFPEFDGTGKVVGLCRRYKDGKYQMPGGNRGLSAPHGFDPAAADLVFVVEGPTDVAAMTAAGLCAVGRPSNSGGAVMLGVLLAGCRADCRIVVVGENDAKDDGDWPGLHGAGSVAGQLSQSLLRHPGSKRAPVSWSLCPDGAKDVRAWLTGRAGEWAASGRELAEKLSRTAVVAESVDKTLRKLTAENRELRARMAAVEEMMREFSRRVSG